MTTCGCGSTMVSDGAVRCRVCAALHDRDKRRAKAKAKAKLAKGRKGVKDDPMVTIVAREALEGVLALLDARLAPPTEGIRQGEGAARMVALQGEVVRKLACMLNERVTVWADVVVKPSHTVTGTQPDADRCSWRFDVIPVA